MNGRLRQIVAEEAAIKPSSSAARKSFMATEGEGYVEMGCAGRGAPGDLLLVRRVSVAGGCGN